MNIGGISIILITGIINLILIAFQLFTGFRIIRVRLGVHKKTGILLAINVSIHVFIAVMASGMFS